MDAVMFGRNGREAGKGWQHSALAINYVRDRGGVWCPWMLVVVAMKSMLHVEQWSRCCVSGKIPVKVVGCVSDALNTMMTDKFLVAALQVVDTYHENRLYVLHEIWKSVPRDQTKYFEAT